MFVIKDTGSTVSHHKLLKIGYVAPDGTWYKNHIIVAEDELRNALAKLDKEGKA